MFAPEAAYYWYPWLWQNGGELLSEDGTTILFNSDAGKEAAEFYVGLTQYSPPDFLNSNSYDGRVAFATGQVAMYVAGAWFAVGDAGRVPRHQRPVGAAPLPQDERCATHDRRRRAGHAGAGQEPRRGLEVDRVPLGAAEHGPLGISARRRTRLAAAAAHSRCSRTRTSSISTRSCRASPSRWSAASPAALPNPHYGEVEDALNDALGRAIYGEIDAADALDEAAVEGEGILSR